MDIAAILFLIFGWIYGITALKVTALVMSAIFTVIVILAEATRGIDNFAARFTEHMIIMALAIISLVI